VTALLAPPVPLPDPPGHPAALAAVVDQLTSAGYAAGLTVHLLGPAVAVIGWQGADAGVAATEVAAATAVAAELHAVLSTARTRLGEHREVWLGVLARISTLREEQRAEYAAAGPRLAALVGPAIEQGGPLPTDPRAGALVDSVAAADADRAAEHRALVAALEEDAAATVRALAAATVRWGGTGRPGAVPAVTLHLAQRLPGWGAAALTALGVQAAGELTGRPTGGELDAAAARWSAWTSAPAFADAVLGRLDADGVTWLLTVLGGRAGTDDEALGGFLAATVATASAAGGRGAAVLGGVQLDPGDPDATVDVVAVGMGLVLTGALVRGRAADTAGLAATWGRQVLARETTQGASATARTAPTSPDPATAALGVLVAARDGAAAARLLASVPAWTALLAHPWPAGAVDLAAVVGLAAGAPTADRVAGAGLQALGQGLAPGTSSRVVLDPGTLGEVGGQLAALVGEQVQVVVELLERAAVRTPGEALRPPADAALAPEVDAGLRGLAHLLVETDRAEVVTEAMAGALTANALPSAAAVAGGYVAVREHAQRMRRVLDLSRAQEQAVDAQIVWTIGVAGPAGLLPGPAGELGGEALDVVAGLVGADGEVDLGPDGGRVRTAADAEQWSRETLGHRPAGDGSMGAAARNGFAQVQGGLGRWRPPVLSALDRIDDSWTPDVPDHHTRRRSLFR